MPHENRVTPYGDIIAVEDRGSFTGNRGCLHDDQGRIRRHHRGRRWIVCELAFKGRRRPLLQPGFYTELFFLDEATALAAGHRPCAECRRGAFEAFRAAWSGGGRPLATEMDAVLHGERTAGPSASHLDELPDGAFIALPGDARPFLVLGDSLLAWTPAGYAQRLARPSVRVEVITPQSTVAALRSGYRPVIHPTAETAA